MKKEIVNYFNALPDDRITWEQFKKNVESAFQLAEIDMIAQPVYISFIDINGMDDEINCNIDIEDMPKSCSIEIS